MKEKFFYTTNELASILGISKQSVLKRMHRGNIKAIKMSRDFIVFRKDINIEKLKAELK